MPRGDKPLWLGANNPTPGLRKTLTDSGFAARRRALGPPPCGLGACALGAPASLGKERKLRQSYLRSITGLRRETRVRALGGR